MKTIINFTKLDLQTVKPYLLDKRSLIYLVLAIILPYGNKEPISAIALVLLFSMLLSTYPFAISDQNNLDKLYIALNIDRKTVVIGRYLTLLLFYVIASILGLIIYILLSIFMGIGVNIKEALFLTITILTIMFILQSLQFPFFFKNGYLKSKSLTYLPFALISIISILFSKIYNSAYKDSFDKLVISLINNKYITISIIILIILLVINVSYRLSYKYYAKKSI